MTDPHYRNEHVTVYAGDCLDVLAELADASVDAVVTDPPYGLEFMGKEWDAPWKTGNGFRRADNPADSGRDNVFGRQSKRGPEYIAGLGFQSWCELWAAECLRVLKPGGHLLAFGGTRTWHRLAAAVEDAGFEIRDSIAWLYGSGFPKSLDVSKAIDRAAGAEREILATGQPVKRMIPGADQNATGSWIKDNGREFVPTETAPTTEAAKQWAGWGTALKPAFEPIVVARKPLQGTVAANVQTYGTGALNIGACRVATDEDRARPPRTPNALYDRGNGTNLTASESNPAGRWPANVVLDHTQAAELDKQSGCTRSGGVPVTRQAANNGPAYGAESRKPGHVNPHHPDEGGASRFFSTFENQDLHETEHIWCDCVPHLGPPHCHLCSEIAGREMPWTEAHPDFPTFRYSAKATSTERPTADGIAHPTVKPVDLMRWLIRLVTPPGGVVLDPFAGTGTTGEAAIHEHKRAILIEREPSYLPLIVARIHKPMQVGFDFDEGAGE